MSIYDELFELIGVHKYSNYFSCRCVNPKHEDSSPSMFVYEDLDKPEGKGFFRCSGCTYKGTHEQLMRAVKGKSHNFKSGSIRKEQSFLPNWSKWQKLYGNIEDLVHSAHTNLLKMELFQPYFKRRELMDMIKPLHLGYKDGWALFPIFDPSGKIVDVLCRSTLKIGTSKYVIHPNNEETPLLYVPNWKRVDSASTCYIVYGIIDAISLEMAGLPVVTGSTGKSLSNKRLTQLNKKWCIIPDRGEESAARELAKSLGGFTQVMRLPYEDEEKDPDNIRTSRGVHILKSLITGA